MLFNESGKQMNVKTEVQTDPRLFDTQMRKDNVEVANSSSARVLYKLVANNESENTEVTVVASTGDVTSSCKK